MPFIEVAIADAKESEAVPEGAYDLRIISSEVRDSKKGKPMLVVGIAIESGEHPNASPLTEYFSLPSGDDEPRSALFKQLQIARLLQAFEVPHEDAGFDPDDLVGCTAEGVKVIQRLVEEDKDGNKLEEPFTVNEIQLPRLRSEPKEEPKKAAAGGKRRK